MDLDRDLVAAALPGYAIGDEIGRGGWGSVLRARHIALGRDVAVKQLPRAFAADQAALDRFISEARIIGQLDHPHIMKVYDFVEHQGTWLIVMELLSGGTLWEYFSAYGTRADQACGIAIAMCSALEAAHDHGILHRDIKPENILFSADGVARLGDFGIAMEVDLDVRRTRAGEVIGTPTYMSPEQAWGHDLGPASDIYSLGIVLYEQLAGRVPFPEAKTPVESLIQHARDLPAPLRDTAPEVPEPIAAVVMRALEKDVGERYLSARDFGVALARASGESFGVDWLHNSGTKLMAGGVIAAAALSAPAPAAPARHPTMAHPALRADHFVGGDAVGTADPSGNHGAPYAAAAAAATVGAAPSAPPLTPPPAMPHPTPPPATPPPVTPPGATPPLALGPDGSPGGPSAPPPGPPPAPPPAPGTASPGAPVPGRPRRSGNGRLVGILTAMVLVAAAAIVALVATRGSGTTAASSSPPATAPRTSTGAPDVTTTTARNNESSGGQPTTTAPRPCPGGARCIFIDDVKLEGDSYVITWTAVGFEPSFKEGFFHAHFFWDIYSPDQAGTNAKTFGVTQGSWEITDTSPFTGKTEITASKRPAPANRLCVTVGNFAHAVADPSHFDCKEVPK